MKRITGEMRKNDFLQFFLEAGKKSKTVNFTNSFVIAQSISFLFAAIEGPSTLLSFSMAMLARFEKYQDIIRKEADTAFSDDEGQISYDAVVQSAAFTEMFLKGT